MHPFTIAAASLIAATVSMGGCETGPKSEPETIAKVGVPVPKPDPARTEYSTLFDLCKSGEATPERVQEFLDLGADVNATDSDRYGWPPLVAAARFSKNPEVVTLLIKAGADVNTKSEDGVTALYMAAFGNENPEVLTVLIEAGADVNWNFGGTALMGAATNNENPEVFTVLIKAGADVNAKGRDDMTPLLVAAVSNVNPEVITLLIRAGAYVNAKTDEGGLTPLHFAATFNENPEILTLLIKAGADVNAKDNYGKTPLDSASDWNKPRNAEVLRAAGGKLGEDLP